jgi:hypothetical protein
MFLGGFAIVLGGILATTASRSFVFQLQTALMLFTSLVVILLLKNIKNGETEAKASNDYLKFLKGGVQFVFSSKTAFLFIMGAALGQVCWTIWGNLILFPLYFGYSGSDSLAGVLRSTIFFIGVGLQVITAKYTKKVENKRLPALMMLQTTGTFAGVIALLYFLPMGNSFHLTGFLLLLLIMTLTISTIMPFIQTIFSRIILDLVPSENRNGIYSLMPTIGNAMVIPLLPFTGALIEASGLIIGVGIAWGISVLGYTMIFLSLYFKSLTKLETVAITAQPAFVGD